VVASVDEIGDGDRKIVSLGPRSIGVFNLGGEYFALRNRCPHQGGPLCEGKLWGTVEATLPGEFRTGEKPEILTCPYHGWEFHVRTGQSWCDPEHLRISTYDVDVEEGRELLEDAEGSPAPGRVKGPYVAESFRVEVNGRYVVIEVPT
jgi:3-phenylpropionate/trans-cinnamate dioxygenase ferredoxin subunit